MLIKKNIKNFVILILAIGILGSVDARRRRKSRKSKVKITQVSKSIKFKSDMISKLSSDSLTANSAHIYYFLARARQKISIAISSYSGKTGFQLESLKKKKWKRVKRRSNRPFRKKLPKTLKNKYRIIVTSKGNKADSYSLFVGIDP